MSIYPTRHFEKIRADDIYVWKSSWFCKLVLLLGNSPVVFKKNEPEKVSFLFRLWQIGIFLDFSQYYFWLGLPDPLRWCYLSLNVYLMLQYMCTSIMSGYVWVCTEYSTQLIESYCTKMFYVIYNYISKGYYRTNVGQKKWNGSHDIPFSATDARAFFYFLFIF